MSPSFSATLARQTDVLVEKGYPALAGLSARDFRALVSPLEGVLGDLTDVSTDGNLPLVLVVTRDLVPTEQAMECVVDNRGKTGVVNMTPVSPGDFFPRPGTELPPASAYVLTDVDLGHDTLDVRPVDALPRIEALGRLPLTIDEGIAVMTQFPDVLQTHNAFQLLASRRGDQRIPSIWLSYDRPRLGWCWDGAPHPWMGSASARARLAA